MRKARSVCLLALLLAGCAHTDRQALWVKGGSYVGHFNQERDWVEGLDNKTVAAEVEVREYKLDNGTVVFSVGGMSNLNSFGKQSYNAHAAVKRCYGATSDIRLCMGAMAGGVTGYKPQTGLAVVPFAAPIASVEYGRWGVDAMVVPSYGRLEGFWAVIVKYKLLEW